MGVFDGTRRNQCIQTPYRGHHLLLTTGPLCGLMWRCNDVSPVWSKVSSGRFITFVLDIQGFISQNIFFRFCGLQVEVYQPSSTSLLSIDKIVINHKSNPCVTSLSFKWTQTPHNINQTSLDLLTQLSLFTEYLKSHVCKCTEITDRTLLFFLFSSFFYFYTWGADLPVWSLNILI